MPIVTVIIPVHNAAAHLREAVDSILHQTHHDLDVLLVDDGSEDDSMRIMEACAEEDVRIRILRFPHRGIVATLNAGLDAAGGDFVARMDADDVALPERIAAQLALLEEEPGTDISAAWARELHPESHHLYRSETTHEAIRCSLLFACDIVHPTILARREVFQDPAMRYDPAFEFAEDYELWPRMLRRHRAAIIPHVLLRYRTHALSIQALHKPLQEQRVRMIHAGLLGELGLEPDDDMLDLHRRIGAWSFHQTKAELRAIDRHLVMLIEANDAARVYDADVLRAYSARRFYHICASTTSTALDGRREFRLSSFAGSYEPTAMQKLRQAMKRRIHRVPPDIDHRDALR